MTNTFTMAISFFSITLSSVTIGHLSTVTSVTTSTGPVPAFSHLPDILQLCSVHLHFPESKDCNWFLTPLPDVPSSPTQLLARVHLLCCIRAKHREGLQRGGHRWGCRGHSALSSASLWPSLDWFFRFSLFQVSAVGSLSPRRSTLYRTLSDESVCSNRKGSSYASSHSSMLDQAMPNDILFSTTPPYHSTLPPRMIHNQAASNLRSKYRRWNSHSASCCKRKHKQFVQFFTGRLRMHQWAYW